MRLSKSSYMSGDHCHLKLWHDFYTRELATEPPETRKAVFETGHEVGEMACRRYPDGHIVAHDHRHVADAIAETRELIEAGSTSTLFEPAFVHKEVLVRTDVLERLPDDTWRLIEVKSSTRLKDAYVLDAAVQLWVLRGVGLDVREADVLTLNRNYVYQGGGHDLNLLFTSHPVTDEAEALLDTVSGNVSELQSMLAQSEAPDIEPGDHCFEPYECPYYAHCTRDFVQPDHGIDELPRLRDKSRLELQELGVEEVRDIPEDFPLTSMQRIVRRAVREDRAILNSNMRREIAQAKLPVRYLDFETFAPAIPRFIGTRPYDAIPFLFSVHTRQDDAAIEHIDCLHEGTDDPRPRVAECLIQALGNEGSICTYSGYERRVIRDLAMALPQRADELNAIADRLFDLLPVVRKGYYHPEFHGSFSIKQVLPVLVPGMDYRDLAIDEGQLAAVRYVQAISTEDDEERHRTFDALREYCAMDTLALARLHEALEKL